MSIYSLALKCTHLGPSESWGAHLSIQTWGSLIERKCRQHVSNKMSKHFLQDVNRYSIFNLKNTYLWAFGTNNACRSHFPLKETINKRYTKEEP